eukprot:7721321-Pyramimonas_sp.AAC.1
MGALVSCEHSRGCFRWSSLWGRETSGGRADMGAVVSCEGSHWRLWWSSPCGHETCEVRWCHANAATGAFGGAPYGAAKREPCAGIGAVVPCD